MNSKQRLDAYIGGQTVDRRPNLTILGSVVARYGGIGMDEYCTDFRRMVECARRAAHDLEIDYIPRATAQYCVSARIRCPPSQSMRWTTLAGLMR